MIAEVTSDAVIELRDVSRTFHSRGREVQALQDVSLSIPRGSAYGIVGESGSGKSTMMRLIAGLDTPTVGRVTVNGTDITGLPERRLGPLRRSLQVVFQDPMGSLDPRMRIGRIVAEPLVAQGHADPAARVREVLGQVDLDPEIVNRYPHQFSGGQRQRISIARAIAPDPEILVADEAVSALDVTVRAQILDLIADIAAARSLTLVFVSHDLSVVRRVCDQVAVLQRGRIVESGPVAEVYDRPQQDYTRQLLAAVPDLQQSLGLARARQDDRERNR
ncbi:MAG: ABC transporter ATP-binding protein [Nakamurella sp.]